MNKYMFKLSKKKNNNQPVQKNNQVKDDCPMCHVSDDVIKSLKGDAGDAKKQPKKHSCCG